MDKNKVITVHDVINSKRYKEELARQKAAAEEFGTEIDTERPEVITEAKPKKKTKKVKNDVV
jgi:hypothetical protein